MAKQQFVAASLALTVAAVMAVPTAAGEGFFETAMHGVRDGFSTRHWDDRNADGYNTELTASQCLNNPHGSPGKVEFTLRRDLSMRPDPDLGSRALNRCYGGWDRGNWGRQTNGNYYAQVHTFDWNTLTVNWLKVVY